MPQAEQILWYYLRGKNLKGYKFRRQYGIGNYILDFYCNELRLGIEVDGDSHFLDPKGNEYDKRREVFLESNQIRLLRFTNDEVRESIEGVIEKISRELP